MRRLEHRSAPTKRAYKGKDAEQAYQQQDTGRRYRETLIPIDLKSQGR